MSDYNMPGVGLFGRRCLIPYGINGKPFVYRIVNSGVKSNTWSETPITCDSEHNPVIHDHFEEVLIVVCDTLISTDSSLIRVALKDVELMPAERHEQRWPVGGVDRTKGVDNISIENAVETPFWMAVWAAEPERLIDVRMSYSDLKVICDLIDEKHRQNCEIKHADAEHPLADSEIVPRLRQIQEQIGGSYAIERAIELMQAQTGLKEMLFEE